MKTIDILGSCVTRDAFAFDELGKLKVNEYFARTSVISLYSNPISAKLDEIELPSAFQKRMVYNDLTKKFKKYIQKPLSDYLIIDFIDERFRILKTRDSYITRSKEYIMSGFKINRTFLPEEERLKLWHEKAEQLINDLNKYYHPEKVILHKAFWQDKYLSENGQLNSFSDAEVAKNNILLSSYYEKLEKNIEGLNVIELHGFVSDEKHKWGLSPFHYQDEYYKEFIRQLYQIIGLDH
ncbi:DUF6270 domain-containing protein [Cytobacillus firmus]|uniref:DUF6270 domain-containing protein n=1 Tax=Cytobacillus firmus TaxID=1399 RepID=UPI0024C1B75A|nr:DUF6270 domain-containing protein [Cytobacillus firmus]WHY33816.1 DUF6270 domain-containing protein [Cytobacillus firmus]